MPSATRAHFLIGRIGREPANVTDRGDDDTGNAPEAFLSTPEATKPEYGGLRALWIRLLERSSVNEMGYRAGEGIGTPAQGLGQRWHGQGFPLQREHRPNLLGLTGQVLGSN